MNLFGLLLTNSNFYLKPTFLVIPVDQLSIRLLTSRGRSISSSQESFFGFLFHKAKQSHFLFSLILIYLTIFYTKMILFF